MEELKRALKCLYLEVESSVVDDISKKVMNVIDKLEKENEQLKEELRNQLKGDGEKQIIAHKLVKENERLKDTLMGVLTGEIYITTMAKEKEAKKWIDDNLEIIKTEDDRK